MPKKGTKMIKPRADAVMLSEDAIMMVKQLAQAGRSKTSIARTIGVARNTLIEMQKRQPELKKALLEGYALSVGKVEDALFQNAYEGNFSAQRFILTNHCPDDYKDQTPNTHINLIAAKLGYKDINQMSENDLIEATKAAQLKLESIDE